MAGIFIAYASKDRATVEKLATCLTEAGHSIWYDKKIKTKGEYPDKRINEELEKADAVVVCWSSVSRERKYVLAEPKYANDKEKIVCVRLNGCDVPVPYNLCLQIDLFPWQGECDDPTVRDIAKACA